LAAANARISSLEAELEASRKAFDAAIAVKTSAEKSSKSALARAKKAEKALSDANNVHLQQEQAVTERLNKMSALVGGEYHAFLFFVELPALYAFISVLIPLYFFPLSCRTYWGVLIIFAAGQRFSHGRS
jgi:hypothetical protein